jgi:enoyl-CoA hydratase/carnithine racemase
VIDRVGDVCLKRHGHVTVVELDRPPYNFFSLDLLTSLAEVFEHLDTDDQCRALVLAAQGRAFCAGADFHADQSGGLFSNDPEQGAENIYHCAVRLFRTRKPVVAAVQGPAIGGGLGLALVADFRVICENTRFSANFVKLGVHAGFGITHVLPRVIGEQNAAMMLYTGRRVGAEEAMAIGLADLLASAETLRERAIGLAAEIAQAAPLAVESTRETLRGDLADAVARQVKREFAEQQRLAATEDHREGRRAVAERRPGVFNRR